MAAVRSQRIGELFGAGRLGGRLPLRLLALRLRPPPAVIHVEKNSESRGEPLEQIAKEMERFLKGDESKKISKDKACRFLGSQQVAFRYMDRLPHRGE